MKDDDSQRSSHRKLQGKGIRNSLHWANLMDQPIPDTLIQPEYLF